ncbi:recombinase family protein [Pectinatus brassicae]|uniref:DNA invertase Pin-like site-specific DNA recombinase n=1 Tax=Pectinatus brassicae TaxID=862415 RepID=A0A840UJS3_9FIRM|nr:recombinase family protein [Pectinatus brassicae]MBB5337396.1 DNA invertase Pin-like site-specific DNA recombinase [Pectinatus brassicae]
METVYNVGIYCRLSREDLKNGKKDVSMSIQNQQDMLEAYVNEKEWTMYKAYIDDDVTGTTFNRPGFQKMMHDIENGIINCVITKDLSRLGRNYIEAGRHRELFNEYGVRYIAIHDNHDSLNDDLNNISTPIKEIMNEMYAADISRKTRSTKKLMASQGKFSNSRAPYGYLKSKEDKHVLAVDENVAHNVIRIFEMYLKGNTARSIADVFNCENILTANEYFYNSIGKPNPFKNNKNKWGSATIMQIIKNPVYYGAMANGKRSVKSFKDKRIISKDIGEWIIIENTHKPLISKKLWFEAQQIRKRNKKQTVRRSSNGTVSIFAGIIKCADCGANLVFNRKFLKSGKKEFFRCGTYIQKGKNVCPMHYVDYLTVYQAVLTNIQECAVLAAEDEKKLINDIFKSNGEFKNKDIQRYEKNIREYKNRIKAIDQLLQSLYEDKISREITTDLFKRMSQKYSNEQEKLIADTKSIEIKLSKYKRVEDDLTNWTNRVKQCLRINTLTRSIVVELIDRIEVSESYNINGEKSLDMNIVYKFNLNVQNANCHKKNRAS